MFNYKKANEMLELKIIICLIKHEGECSSCCIKMNFRDAFIQMFVEYDK